MNKAKQKQFKKQRRAVRARARVRGTAARPRLSVHRTLNHISVQFIDDVHSVTLAAVSDAGMSGTKQERAAAVGKAAAKAAAEKKIAEVVFDRGSALYHGRVKVLAESAREAGLKF